MRWVLLALVVLASGCGATRTVYVPHGQPVRLRETVKNVKVWALDENDRPVAGVLDLPEGWYVVSYETEESQ